MARLTLAITTHNAAFDIDPNAEVARILRDVAERIEAHPIPLDGSEDSGFVLFDANGHRIGRADYAP